MKAHAPPKTESNRKKRDSRGGGRGGGGGEGRHHNSSSNSGVRGRIQGGTCARGGNVECARGYSRRIRSRDALQVSEGELARRPR